MRKGRWKKGVKVDIRRIESKQEYTPKIDELYTSPANRGRDQGSVRSRVQQRTQPFFNQQGNVRQKQPTLD